MPIWADFVGGTYQARSSTIAADQAVNVYVETRQVPGGAKQATLYGTPGLIRQATVATIGNRGWFSQDGRTFTVVGNRLYAVDTDLWTTDDLGEIVDDGLPVSFASNGRGGEQLAIVGGGQLKVFALDTDTLSAAIALPFAGPVMIVFQDGYGIINERDSPIAWFSALEDFESWDAIDFFTRSASSDNIVGLAVTQDRLWVLGSKTLTLYYDSGDADVPWVPYPGTTTQIGLTSPTLLGVYRDQVFWVATSNRGQRQVVVATTGQAPQPISTPPIDAWLATAPTVTDASLLIYEQSGHPFVIVTAPQSTEAVQTYAFDAREQLWHARADWDSIRGVYTRWRVAGLTTVGPHILGGDAFTGKLYELDLNTYTNDGDVLMRDRTAPYLGSENQWAFLEQFELGTQPGVGLISGQGSDPLVELQISRDGAHTWVSAGFASLGAMGQYLTRTIWRRLGRARLDRLVVRVRQSDPVRCVWGPGAWLRFEQGTGQL